jgi:uncharacterized protein YndB with AHSA1/START domain
MPEQSVIHNTFVVERTYPKNPEQVFNAFADPAKKSRWFAPGVHHEVENFEMDFRTGGAEHLRYRFKEGSPFPGSIITNEGAFCDIVPNRRIVISSTMALDDRRISVSLVTLEFMPTGQGTDLVCTHQGVFFEGSDGPQIREAGWRSLFDKLAADLAQ